MTRIVRKGYGMKDGSRKGYREGGKGRNRTDNCRHPTIRRRRV